jgi:hypothetical protein
MPVMPGGKVLAQDQGEDPREDCRSGGNFVRAQVQAESTAGCGDCRQRTYDKRNGDRARHDCRVDRRQSRTDDRDSRLLRTAYVECER